MKQQKSENDNNLLTKVRAEYDRKMNFDKEVMGYQRITRVLRY